MTERIDWLLTTREGLLTLSLFAGFFGAGLAEIAAPRRRAGAALGRRWLTNFTLSAAGIGIAALVIPAIPAVAPAVGDLWSGLMAANVVLAITVGVLLSDLLRYGIHRAFHASTWLWRVHAVHHADSEIDVTTAFRHHPGEHLAVVTTLVLAESLMGMPRAITGAYAVLALLWTPIVHADVAFPRGLDRLLSPILVTPDFHAVHHSREVRQGNSNYGMLFSFWDRLFGTAQAHDRPTLEALRFGVDGIAADRSRSLWSMLLLPLSRTTA